MESKYTEITLEQITEVYLNTELNSTEAAAALGISRRTLSRALKHHGIRGKGRTSDNPWLRDKVWLSDRYLVDKWSCKKIADETGMSRGAVHSALRWAGIPLRTAEEGWHLRYPQGRLGAEASNWRGGRKKAHGYVMIYKPDHPYHNTQGYVMQHRLIMEEHLGRILDPKEEVHHKNEIQDDNRLENLEVLTHQQHRDLHAKRRADKALQKDRVAILERRMSKELEQIKLASTEDKERLHAEIEELKKRQHGDTH